MQEGVNSESGCRQDKQCSHRNSHGAQFMLPHRLDYRRTPGLVGCGGWQRQGRNR
jgi:hypothetical protein